MDHFGVRFFLFSLFQDEIFICRIWICIYLKTKKKTLWEKAEFLFSSFFYCFYSLHSSHIPFSWLIMGNCSGAASVDTWQSTTPYTVRPRSSIMMYFPCKLPGNRVPSLLNAFLRANYHNIQNDDIER